MFTNSQVLLQRISYKSDLPPAKRVILCLEAGESKATHLRCLCCSQAADVELGAETGTMWATAAVKTGFSPFAPLAASSLAPNHHLARGERWFGTLRRWWVQLDRLFGTYPFVLFGSSRRMQLSLGIQLRAELYQIVLERSVS